MKLLAATTIALAALSHSAMAQNEVPTYTYKTRDGQCTMKCEGKRIKMHFAKDLFMSVVSEGHGNLTPVVYNGDVKKDQSVCVLIWWNDGKEERDVFLTPRTYRDAYYTRSLMNHRFYDHMASCPDSVTLSVPYEDELVEETFYLQQ